MIHWLLSLFLLVQLVGNKPAYQIFDRTGNSTSYDSMISELSDADVILFGEIHNSALVHWLELQVAKGLYTLDTNLVLGLEMLEADNQLLVDEYIDGLIEKRHFTQEAKLWDNYATDYQPLVDFAKENDLSVVATNIPRRYASLVSRQGIAQLDSLSDQSKQWIAPLPIEVDTTLESYRNMLVMMGGSQAPGGRIHGGMNGERMVQAQAIKDATMAHFIQKFSQQDGFFLHINGSYHSDKFEGIYWYLQQQAPELIVKTISCVEQSKLDSLLEENQQLADFIIAIPDDMAKTY